MTDEELIARLRDLGRSFPNWQDGFDAADRIEALVKACDRRRRMHKSVVRRMCEQKARAERLEAAIQWRITDLEKNGFSHIHAALQGTLKAVLNEARAAPTQKKLTDGWKCPINYPGCTKNCGSYGCGN